jgi:hypothetical protein
MARRNFGRSGLTWRLSECARKGNLEQGRQFLLRPLFSKCELTINRQSYRPPVWNVSPFPQENPRGDLRWHRQILWRRNEAKQTDYKRHPIMISLGLNLRLLDAILREPLFS